jgi:hypothetical protein
VATSNQLHTLAIRPPFKQKYKIMKLYYFKIPEKSILSFIRLIETYDMYILVSWKEDGDIFSNNFIVGYLRLQDNAQIPPAMQLEKLNEKFGNNVKAV